MIRTYDVFISFKNSDASGRQTKDSVLAERLYRFLIEKGVKAFFSNVELEFIGKAQYTKVIDDALESSEILVAVGCSKDNLESKWVNHEWASFLNDIRSGIKPDAEVFVLYDDMTAHDLPRSLRQQQAFNASDDDSYEKLYNFIKNAMDRQGKTKKGSDSPMQNTPLRMVKQVTQESSNTDYSISLSRLGDVNKSWTLRVRGGLMVGRAATNDIVLDEKSVAREQCKIVIGGAGLTVINLSTTNITKLNGRTLAGPAPLNLGDNITMGRETLLVDDIRSPVSSGILPDDIRPISKPRDDARSLGQRTVRTDESKPPEQPKKFDISIFNV